MTKKNTLENVINFFFNILFTYHQLLLFFNLKVVEAFIFLTGN